MASRFHGCAAHRWRRDEGADILAVRDREQWVLPMQVLQPRRRSTAPASTTPNAPAHDTRADHAVVVTNTGLNATAEARRKSLGSIGITDRRLDRAQHLTAIFEQMPAQVPTHLRAARVSADCGDRVEADLEANGRALLVLATGLGKTVVGGEVIRRHLAEQARCSGPRRRAHQGARRTAREGALASSR